MQLRTFFALAVVAAGWSLAAPSAAWASRADSADTDNRSVASGDFLEARQYHITKACVAGQISARQSVTAWQVMQGNWNGESLDGLSLVLVETMPEEGAAPPATHCYISHLATPAQRTALLDAYVASHASVQTPDRTSWRVEAAVIKFEMAGHFLVLHLGAIA